MLLRMVSLGLLLVLSGSSFLSSRITRIPVIGELLPPLRAVSGTGGVRISAAFEPLAGLPHIPTRAHNPFQTPVSEWQSNRYLQPAPVLAFYRYYLQPGTPVYGDNFGRLGESCSFPAVAGLVFDEAGTIVSGLLVQVTNTLTGDVVGLDITGPHNTLPPGGFVIQLAEQTIETRGLFQVQVVEFDEGSGVHPLSEPVLFDTYPDCSRNLAVVNFIDPPGPIFLPLIVRP
jgi:hypothetical protein